MDIERRDYLRWAHYNKHLYFGKYNADTHTNKYEFYAMIFFSHLVVFYWMRYSNKALMIQTFLINIWYFDRNLHKILKNNYIYTTIKLIEQENVECGHSIGGGGHFMNAKFSYFSLKLLWFLSKKLFMYLTGKHFSSKLRS